MICQQTNYEQETRTEKHRELEVVTDNIVLYTKDIETKIYIIEL